MINNKQQWYQRLREVLYQIRKKTNQSKISESKYRGMYFFVCTADNRQLHDLFIDNIKLYRTSLGLFR